MEAHTGQIDPAAVHDFADELHELADRGLTIAPQWLMRQLRRRFGVREPMAQSMPEWISIDDACAVSGLSRSFIYAAMSAADGPARLSSRKVGRRRLVELASLRGLGRPA